jgi:type IV pilus assembly protein PilB
MGIYEMLVMSDEIRDAITSEASGKDIGDLARTQGMTTLREAGLKLIFDGKTTIDEVVRETVMDDVE